MATPAAAEDRSASAGFEPETILPSQLLDLARLGAGIQPEKRLMLAVLEDAVATFQRTATATSRIGMRDFGEVDAWLTSDDVAWPYSFLNVCHVLGFDPSCLRRGLARWLEREQAHPDAGNVVRLRFAFRRISGSRTRAVVPRRLRSA